MTMHDAAATFATTEVMRRFHDAFDRHDTAAFVDLVAEDCFIENTGPAPEGSRHLGKAACLQVWQGLAAAEGTWFTREEVWAVGERVVVRWRYHWGDGPGQSVRGLNLMRVKGGQVVEALGYVKSR